MKVLNFLSGVVCALFMTGVQAADANKSVNKAASTEVSRIVLIGPPASGKGTQAKNISEKLSIPTISTGNLLRKAVKEGHPLAKTITDSMQKGALVSNEIVLKLLRERLSEKDCAKGFILDGFPRSLEQAKYLSEAGIKIDHVIDIRVSDDEVVSRISGRRVHTASGRSYHIRFNPPKKPGKDDITGEDLVIRDDDKPEIIKKRLTGYRNNIDPVIGWYKNQKSTRYHEINGNQSIAEVRSEIFKTLLRD